MAKDKHYGTLMEYLKALHREGAVITNWLPEYGKDGKIKVTVEVQEKL